MKEFIIFKNNQVKNEKSPTHKMMAKINNELVEIGACWSREGKNGNKFLSCKLSSAYVNKEKNIARRGFTLTQEENSEVMLANSSF